MTLMNPSTSNSYLYKKLTSFNMSLITAVARNRLRMSPNPQAPGYEERVRLRKSTISSDRFWPNLATVKNSRLSRYRSPAIIIIVVVVVVVIRLLLLLLLLLLSSSVNKVNR